MGDDALEKSYRPYDKKNSEYETFENEFTGDDTLKDVKVFF
jgi:hypothetical protein